MRGGTVTTVILVTACSNPGGGGEPIVTEPVRHLEVSLAPAGGDLAASAADYVLSAGLGLTDQDDFEVIATLTGPDRVRHARLQQVHAGVPVFASE
ncbi:MAG TPA: hypothetical protein VFU21_18360, partial [Kofleriaceae bacterium]|nr:hypothetical protein [Kofleriaceae bacterium]